MSLICIWLSTNEVIYEPYRIFYRVIYEAWKMRSSGTCGSCTFPSLNFPASFYNSTYPNIYWAPTMVKNDNLSSNFHFISINNMDYLQFLRQNKEWIYSHHVLLCHKTSIFNIFKTNLSFFNCFIFYMNLNLAIVTSVMESTRG